jgi:hypothetical protein
MSTFIFIKALVPLHRANSTFHPVQHLPTERPKGDGGLGD